MKVQYHTTFKRLQAVREDVLQFEEMHLIEERWTPESGEYQAAKLALSQRKYLKAVDELERLVIQRLLEMTKLGIGGVGAYTVDEQRTLIDSYLGYKMRSKIGKALKSRSEAIRTALKSYNSAASQLIPPREPLTWAGIMNIADLAEFDLLKDTRQQVHEKPWAKPVIREAIWLHLKIKRAREEISRLDVEMAHLITFMRDEYGDYRNAIKASEEVHPFVSRELIERHQYCNKITHQIITRLIQVSKLPGFTGAKHLYTMIICLSSDSHIIGSLTAGQHIERGKPSPKSACPAWLSPEGVLQEPDESVEKHFDVERNDVDTSVCEHLIEQLME